MIWSIDSLQTHFDTEHSMKPFYCKEHKKFFAHKKNLTDHLKKQKHNNGDYSREQEFFSSVANIASYIQTHGNDSPFVKVGADASLLNRHLNTTTN